MSIKVSNADVIALDQIANDANDANANGIFHADGTTPYAQAMVPVSGYSTIIAPASSNEQLVKDGTKAIMAPLYRRVSPIAAMGEVPINTLGVTVAAGNNYNLLNVDLPDIQEVPRSVLVTLQFSGYVSAAATVLFFVENWEVGFTSTRAFRFNSASEHLIITSSWIINLPVIDSRPHKFKAWVRTDVGGGDFVMDGNDWISLTVVG